MGIHRTYKKNWSHRSFTLQHFRISVYVIIHQLRINFQMRDKNCERFSDVIKVYVKELFFLTKLFHFNADVMYYYTGCLRIGRGFFNAKYKT